MGFLDSVLKAFLNKRFFKNLVVIILTMIHLQAAAVSAFAFKNDALHFSYKVSFPLLLFIAAEKRL